MPDLMWEFQGFTRKNTTAFQNTQLCYTSPYTGALYIDSEQITFAKSTSNQEGKQWSSSMPTSHFWFFIQSCNGENLWYLKLVLVYDSNCWGSISLELSEAISTSHCTWCSHSGFRRQLLTKQLWSCASMWRISQKSHLSHMRGQSHMISYVVSHNEAITSSWHSVPPCFLVINRWKIIAVVSRGAQLGQQLLTQLSFWVLLISHCLLHMLLEEIEFLFNAVVLQVLLVLQILSDNLY